MGHASSIRRRLTGALSPPTTPPTRWRGLPLSAWLAIAVLGGLAVRLWWTRHQPGMHHPDEIFQYLEPAWQHMHGAGYTTWEFSSGARNWVLPAFCGALLELGERLGLEGPALLGFVRLNFAILGTLLVPLGMRLGLAASDGDPAIGVAGAFGCALFPVLGYFAPHTLSETAALLPATWATAIWLEHARAPHGPGHRGRTVALGVVLGLTVIVRYALGWLVVIVLLERLSARDWRGLARTLVGGGICVVALAALDWLTWGIPLQSLGNYLYYNLVTGQASVHGVSPWWAYLDGPLGERIGGWPGRIALLGPALLVVRRAPRLTMAWLVPLLVLSAIPHKEERFLLTVWPCLLVASALGWQRLGHWLFTRTAQGRRDGAGHWPGVPLFAMFLVTALALPGTLDLPMRWKAGVFEAQYRVGLDAGATGVLVEDRPHLNGGRVLLNRVIVQQSFDPALLASPVYSHVIVYSPGSRAFMDERVDFAHIADLEQGVAIYERR